MKITDSFIILTDKAYDFHDGLARVELNGRRGFIRYIPPPRVDKEEDLPDAPPQEITVRNVKEGQRLKINNERIVLKIYDYKKIDGDIVSINYKGNWLVKNHTLSRKPHELEIELERGSDNNYLLLYADNLGRNPPNTAAITILDGEEKKEIVLNSDLNNCDIIYFDY